MKVGVKSRTNTVYKCSGCRGLSVFLKGETLTMCHLCTQNNVSQHWEKTSRDILIVTKNVRKEIEKNQTSFDRIADYITNFCGSIPFLVIHVLFFAFWLAINLVTPYVFDPYPFGMLTLIVSLEAILLSTFILMSQNRSEEIMDMRADLDYQTDLKAEKSISEILALTKHIERKMTKLTQLKKED